MPVPPTRTNAATTASGCLNFDATATGVMTNNMVGNGAAQNTQILATGMAKNQNIGAVTTEDLSGIAEPTRA